MATSKTAVVKQPPTLDELIKGNLANTSDDRTPEQITADIVAQNLAAESLDDLFRELESAKDDFVNVPFICDSIGFRTSTVGDSEYYAIIGCHDSSDAYHFVSCSSPDVYSKLLAMQKLGVLETTPVVIRSKTTQRGYEVLKLDRVSMDDFKSGQLF